MFFKLPTLLFVFFIASCGAVGLKPMDPPFLADAPSGEGIPPEFTQGWMDGCDTGKAQHGSDVYRSYYKFKQDPSLVMNPVYYKAWKDSENYCRLYMYEYSVRNAQIYCSVDGLRNDCETDQTKTPFGYDGDAIGGLWGNSGGDFLGGEGFFGGAGSGDFFGY